jgi:hypothetical protein
MRLVELPQAQGPQRFTVAAGFTAQVALAAVSREEARESPFSVLNLHNCASDAALFPLLNRAVVVSVIKTRDFRALDRGIGVPRRGVRNVKTSFRC